MTRATTPRRAHVAVVFNSPVPRALGRDWASRAEGRSTPGVVTAEAADSGVRHQVKAIARVLARAGYRVSTTEVRDVRQLCAVLDEDKPDAVFNCCEALGGRADLEMHLAAVFELLGLPYTGSTPLALGAALDKAVAKALLAAHGVSTPPALALASAAEIGRATHLGWPLIVKPLAEDASIGIDRHAVVYDVQALSDRVRFVVEEFHTPALVEAFIDGREFTVSLLATSSDVWTALPIGEVAFDGLPAGHPRVLTYDAKWCVESDEYKATVLQWPALDHRLSERLRSIALQAARAIGIRDYGRVDIRMNEADGSLYVLEVNPNPDLTPDSGFVALAPDGVSHNAVVLEILSRALERAASRPRRR